MKFSQCGPYVPPAPAGDGCDEPIKLTIGPDGATYAGDNLSASGFTNGYSVESTCIGGSVGKGGASNDVVVELNAEQAGVYTITVAGFDAAIYLQSTCDDVSTCIEGADAGGSSDAETLIVELDPGTPVYLFIDGWSGTANIEGSFDLTVSAPCTPTCQDKECGTDGCVYCSTATAMKPACASKFQVIPVTYHSQ